MSIVTEEKLMQNYKFLERSLVRLKKERDDARKMALIGLKENVKQRAINNMLWDIVDYVLYGKEFVIEIPENETEDEREMRILKESVLKGSIGQALGRKE